MTAEGESGVRSPKSEGKQPTIPERHWKGEIEKLVVVAP
jgi:hypothetical protein